MKIFKWNDEKNNKLKSERDVSFEVAVRHINSEDLLDVIEHPNQKKYPNQKIFVIQMNSYVYYVPFIDSGNEIFLKNIIPSRKLKKIYKVEDNYEE